MMRDSASRLSAYVLQAAYRVPQPSGETLFVTGEISGSRGGQYEEDW